MNIIYNKDIKDKLTVSIGSFDGIHLGHKTLLKELINKAKQNRSKSALITFSPHPRQVVDPNFNLKLLYTDNEKKEIITHLGIDFLIVIEFSQEFRRLTPQEFIENLISNYKIIEFVIGYNHSFGRNREGTSQTIKSILQPYNIKYSTIQEIKIQNNKISSTIIRKALTKHQYKHAAKLLGYYFFLTGTTISGHKVGRKIGYPTINIKPPTNNKLLPENGVYLVKIKIKNDFYFGLTNIGTRPTFNDTILAVETFVFDFNQQIYGNTVKIFFLERIRSEIHFPNAQNLIQQINKDILQAQKIIKEKQFEANYFI